MDTLDHLPPLPLFITYGTYEHTVLTEQDELGICHALRLHGRIRHIDLGLPPSILYKVVVLMDEHFPILEHLSLLFAATGENSLPLALPKAFLAPKLRHLALPSVSPPRRLRVLNSTVFLVRLELVNIPTSGYFRPRVLVARLSFLPQLEELFIGFSIPIPSPSTERELLGEQGTPVTLPTLKKLWFKGVGAYLECVVAQIRAPLLERLGITFFNQIIFALPHLSHFINIAKGFKPPIARIHFLLDEVSLTMAHHNSPWFEEPFRLRVKCKQLDWQIDCAAQICDALIPTLSGVERLTLDCAHDFHIPAELYNGVIGSTMWHDLLRPFIGVKELYIRHGLSEALSRALRLDEVGSALGFLPALLSITAAGNSFTSFIDIRRVVGRPVEFSSWGPGQRHGHQQSWTKAY